MLKGNVANAKDSEAICTAGSAFFITRHIKHRSLNQVRTGIIILRAEMLCATFHSSACIVPRSWVFPGPSNRATTLSSDTSSAMALARPIPPPPPSITCFTTLTAAAAPPARQRAASAMSTLRAASGPAAARYASAADTHKFSVAKALAISRSSSLSASAMFPLPIHARIAMTPMLGCSSSSPIDALETRMQRSTPS
ncbi:Os01g0890950 [Oryza sativa Japonica Group]|uniref:Os01g0890950 protein n=1 Tax=Oryza sativa subsp. japonica TaxID=39947 RepID=A0A0P0VBG8_ORYSJ|nr:hypothetical protein EE612_007308 [Oryza sativa]BAS75658.1 Os01g0890950 [Oryza sativa Japonica Group]